MSQAFQIAIDGPVAAGKGTVSKLVAERLGFLYVDTGAMYRVAALLAIRNKLEMSLKYEDKIAQAVDQVEIMMRNPKEDEADGRLTTVLVDREDVSWKIRTEKIGLGASAVSQLSKVRQVLVKKQQVIANNQNVIMEGRDITYRVLPNAQLKIFLTASDTVRAKRRYTQLLVKGQDTDFEQVYHDMSQRDKNDLERANDPLKIVDEAWVIDTSDLEIDKVVDLICAKAKLMME
ncbi:MAG: (d)CMP kinase [Patescibacteria group bacterium]